jgi:predicted RNA-binding Zn ribbon-like protein
MNSLSPIPVESHQFSAKDYVGGDPALDFINTVTGRDKHPRDWIDSYGRLVEWAALTNLLPWNQLRVLKSAALAEPRVAANALVKAKRLREASFEVIRGIASGKAPPRTALTLLRKHWIEGVDAHDLHFEDGRIRAELIPSRIDLGLISSVVAYRIAEQVLSLPVERVRVCQGDDCSWVFFDSSKAGRRRWCDMSVCGNAAKSRRFRASAHRPQG